ncbi:MAG: hypothetical protein V8Q75_03385 [Bacilli bacterium]
MTKYIVDGNGEIIEVINDNEVVIKVGQGDRIVRKKSIDYFYDTKEIKKRFIKVNDQATNILSKYGKYICLLLKYVGYMDGILRFNNGIYLSNKSISKIFGISERNTIKILNDLIKEDVIHKHKEKNKNYYTFNPWIASKGKRVSIDLYNEFKMTEWVNKSQEPSDYETIVKGDEN